MVIFFPIDEVCFVVDDPRAAELVEAIGSSGALKLAHRSSTSILVNLSSSDKMNFFEFLGRASRRGRDKRTRVQLEFHLVFDV
jgi:hypothetical protein